MINNYDKVASIYAKDSNDGTAYLAFKYIPEILKKYSNGKKTLDFGCGSGLSTRFLKNINLSAEGADISKSMLHEAQSQNDGILYKLIQNDILPYPSNHFDVVFSSFVLFEIESKVKLIHIFKEIYRVLKNNGIFIAITGSEELYKYPWLSLDVDFPENKNPKSGSIVSVHLKEINLTVHDYFWTDNDYLDVIKNTKFSMLKKQFPLGDYDDGFPWVSEIEKPPYVIYVLKK